MEQHIQKIVTAAVQAADPARLVAQHLALQGDMLFLPDVAHDLSKDSVKLVAIGKAAIPMAQEAIALMGKHISAGVIASKLPAPGEWPDTIQFFRSAHPVPDRQSVAAGEAIEQLLAGTTPEDLVLCLISGGASALVCLPRLPLEDWQALNQTLLRAGCPIGEINLVRQWFDRLKGGGLAQMAAPAKCASLILSDVIGNDLASIGSGPTVMVDKAKVNVQAVLDDYGVWSYLPETTSSAIKELLRETLPAVEISATTPVNHIIGDVGLACKAAQKEAQKLGYQAHTLTTTLEGEARVIGRMAARLTTGGVPDEASIVLLPDLDSSRPYCLILGGETTVTVRGDGAGGRNQELALAAALDIEGNIGVSIASFATDGEDGLLPPRQTPVAGAFVDGQTVPQAAAKGLDASDYLGRNDSYGFFQALEQGHLTAERGTNVNDLLLVFKGPAE